MPTARAGLGCAAVGEVVYAVGGHGVTAGYQPVAVVEAFGTVAAKWTTLPPMPTARLGLAVAVVKTTLYAIGGDYGSGATDVVEAFDTNTQKWSTLQLMPTPRFGLAVGVVGTIIYAVGGYDGSVGFLGTVEAFDTVAGTWSEALPAMPTRRPTFGIGVVGTTLYCMGGMDSDGGPVGTLEALSVRCPTRYVCDRGQCRATTDGTGTDQPTCQATCKPPPPAYVCSSTTRMCTVSANPAATNKTACEAACTKPPPSPPRPPNPSPPFAPGELDFEFRICFSGAVTQAAGIGDALKACWLPYGIVLLALILVGLTMYVDKAASTCTLALASMGVGRGASGRGKHTLLDKCRWPLVAS